MTKSIYDQLNASGTVAKQRFVETFSGSLLDTDRWDIYNSGTVPQGMADSIDGGYYITTTNSWDQVRLNFNDKRQFSGAGSRENEEQQGRCRQSLRRRLPDLKPGHSPNGG